MAGPIQENNAAFVRSVVGRTPALGTFRRRPPALPEITRICYLVPVVQGVPLRKDKIPP